MNQINIIAPYKYMGLWVFDDPRVGLVQEPFVAGADGMIDRVVADIPNAEPYLKEAMLAVVQGSPVAHAITKPYGCSVKY